MTAALSFFCFSWLTFWLNYTGSIYNEVCKWSCKFNFDLYCIPGCSAFVMSNEIIMRYTCTCHAKCIFRCFLQTISRKLTMQKQIRKSIYVLKWLKLIFDIVIFNEVLKFANLNIEFNFINTNVVRYLLITFHHPMVLFIWK